jgi:hypothetical protein
MSYPNFMTDEELVTHGFVVFEDNPKKAYSSLYPTFSFRHKCDTCGRWSAVFGNGRRMECVRCFTGGKPFEPTLQSYKLYMCCFEQDCPVRRQALEMLHDAGIELDGPRHEGIGECYSLEQIKDWPEDKRIEFLLTLNNISVSKFRARKLVHPGSKGNNARSRLPKKT